MAVMMLVLLSPLLIFGIGPLPGLGIAGGLAVVLTTVLMLAILTWHVLRGRSLVAPSWTRPCWRLVWAILDLGAIDTVNTLNTALIMVLYQAAPWPHHRLGVLGLGSGYLGHSPRSSRRSQGR